ncbi:MAG TPA: hypothetical protein VIK33_13570, partial [Anaerolineae bacterium]
LRAIPPVWAGVLIPLGLLLVLGLIPYAIDRKAEGVAEWFHPSGRAAQIITILVFTGLIVLTLSELGM